jgi:hypothetical protein
MGFHKRYISNEQVIRLFNDGGVQRIIQWYTRGADAVITETGLASKVSTILEDPEWLTVESVNLDEAIINLIHKELGTEDELKK